MPDYNTLNLKLGDIEFIRQKELDGDWITVTGAIDAITNEIAYTPASGKTFFLFSAKIINTGHSNPPSMASTTGNAITNNRVQAVLKVDTVVKDTANVGFVYNATSSTTSNGRGAGTGSGEYKCDFDVIGLSLVGNAVKKVTVENTLDNGSAIATMIGWIEDT